MANIGYKLNTASILGKVNKYLGSSAGNKKINESVKLIMSGTLPHSGKGSVHTPEEAAEKLCSCLRDAANSSGMNVGQSAGQIKAVSEWAYGSPRDLGNGTWEITVSPGGATERESLVPEKYGGVDIYSLLDNGVDHTMKYVWGEWHGNYTGSRTVIPGSHFIDQGIRDFEGNYGTEYGVISIVRS